MFTVILAVLAGTSFPLGSPIFILRILARASVSSVNWVHAPSTKEEQMQDRLLTYDEQKAADAAFAGKPFNSDWSSNSKAIYDGIVVAMARSHADCELKPTGR
jgi:hypothetical protein